MLLVRPELCMQEYGDAHKFTSDLGSNQAVCLQLS